MCDYTRIIRWALLLIACLFLDRSSACSQDADALNLHADLRDVLLLPDVKLTLLDGRNGPSELINGEDKPLFQIPGRKRKHFERLFFDPADEAGYYAAAMLGANKLQGFAVYHFTAGKLETVLETKQRTNPASYFQSAKGEIFVASRRGFIYLIAGEKVTTHKLSESGNDFREYGLFREMHFAESTDGTVCLYSLTVENERKNQLRNVLVARGGNWTEIDLRGHITGPACFLDDKHLFMVTGKECLTINVETAEIQIDQIDVPKISGQELKPEFLMRLADGTLLGLWRQFYHSEWSYDVGNFADGKFYQFAALKADHWELLGIGKDRQLYMPPLHVHDQVGGTWFSRGEGGLLYRSAKGTWREFDFREGIYSGQIERLVLDANGQIWSFDNRRQLAQSFDPDALLASETHRESAWSIIHSRTRLTTDRHGYASLLSLEHGGEIHAFRDQQIEKIPLPPASDFTCSGTLQLSQDRFDNYWLFAEGQRDQTTVRRNGQWKVYNVDRPQSIESQNPDGPSSKEIAFVDALSFSREPGFHIGNDLDKYRVAFGPDNQIAYRNAQQRISYYDGQQWNSPRSGREVDQLRAIHHPLFREGDVVLPLFGKNAIQMRREDWNQSNSHDDRRPWQRIELVEMPKQRLWIASMHAKKHDPPPIKQDWWYTTADGLWFAGNRSELAFRDQTGIWRVMPLAKSPLYGNPELEGIYVDPVGRWFLELKTSWIFKYAVFAPEAVPVRQTATSLGAVLTPFQTVIAEWNSDLPINDLITRCRVDDGKWSNWIPASEPIAIAAVRTTGRHKLDLQVASTKEFLTAASLKYEFEANYELADFVKPLCEKLGSASFAERQLAMEKLLDLGEVILPELMPYIKSEDIETAVRVQTIVAQLSKMRSSD